MSFEREPISLLLRTTDLRLWAQIWWVRGVSSGLPINLFANA